jgi:hypothetical protein
MAGEVADLQILIEVESDTRAQLIRPCLGQCIAG